VGVEMISGFSEERILSLSSGFMGFNFPFLKIEALNSSEMPDIFPAATRS
jgi:hypothetical protein